MKSQYQLCFYSGSLTGKIYPIVKEETKIGRDASCDIVLTENSVSRIHVFLYVQQNGSIVLVDNNSTNGTVVNNYQISAPVQLSENDVIGLGGEVMIVFQKATGFDPGSQWNSKDMPAGNAPESYNFEKKQGNPMNNDNSNFPNDGAAGGFANNSAQSQQPADNYGFNQAYNMNFNNPGFPQGQMPYGYGQPGQFGQYDPNGFGNQQMNAAPADAASAGMNPVPADKPAEPAPADMGQAQPLSGNDAAASQQPQQPFGADPYGQQQMGQQMPYGQQQMAFGSDPYGQQQMGQQMQNPYGNNPYGQQQMGQQMPYGNNPYGQQMPYGNDPYSQQMGQPQMPFGNDPYGQQQMGQPQNPYGGDPYSQQMGQPQNPYGNDPYGQQQMGQPQNPYGGDPYSQQMGQPQMPYGNDPYGQQQMGQMQNPYGNNPYGQQQMGQMQNPYGNNPYGQQQMGQMQNPYGNNPYAQQQQFYGAQAPAETETKSGSKKKLFITLGIVLAVLILIAAFIIYVDQNRLWCDFFPFLWDADTCANYMR